MNAPSPTDGPATRGVRTILVGLDGSRFSERALPAAAALASRLRWQVFLFSAVPSEEEADERLRRLSALRPRGLPTDIDVLPDPDPADAIDTVLRDLGAAVACVASHGAGRSAALLGSVTNEVIRRRMEPTIVVGPGFSHERMGSGVVVCVDGTEPAAEILPTAVQWSELLDVPLTVVTVAEPVPPPLRGGPPHRRFGPEENVERFLDELAAPLRAEGHLVATKVVYDPISPASGLRRHLWDNPASLVAVGSHLRRTARHPVLGRVAASMVRQSLAPTLVVPRVD